MYAECPPKGNDTGGNGAEGEPVYNAEHIVHFGAIIIREKLLSRCGGHSCSGSAGPVYAAPKDVYQWVSLFHASDVRVVPVRRLDDFCSALVEQEVAGWLCIVNLCPRPEQQCRALCCQYCQWLMRDCSVLGRGCPECYPVPLAEMRDKIAHAVAAELC